MEFIPYMTTGDISITKIPAHMSPHAMTMKVEVLMHRASLCTFIWLVLR
jgi:hypothetical protein